AQNPLRCFGERTDGNRCAVGTRLIVPAIDENRDTSGRASRRDVAPAIANHVAARQGDSELPRGGEHHAGFWFSAVARVSIVVRAYPDVIERKRRTEGGVHCVEGGVRQGAARDLGLVGDNDEKEAGRPKACQCFLNAGKDFQLFDICRRERPAAADDRPVDDAVAIYEDGAPDGCVDSHLVGRVWRSGCDTSRCQITAWKASECGVTRSGCAVGTRTQASATVAVNPPFRPTTPPIAAPCSRANCSARTMFGLTLGSR